MEYGEGKYYDEEMANIIADAAEREFVDTCASVQAESDAEQEYLDRLAQQELDDWENRQMYGIEW